ncbi:MAG: PD-(D/E)XK nuclease family protein [Eubacterium sp.]|nr:PD-(D/E)XK nuclease family protein [Eubacterium sp.]
MLQLILGRAGYGKTEYVFTKIKELVDSGNKDIILLVPEQFSYSSERRLLSDLGANRVNSVSCLSFSRLSNEIASIYGGNELPLLTKGARAVMMKKALLTAQDALKLFNTNITSNSFINSVLKIYDEMKSCRITSDDLRDACEDTQSELLKLKLGDIALIMDAYDALIEGEYYDSENELTRLYHKLSNLDFFKGKTVFIDGFSGFVAQEYKIIEVMIKQTKDLFITFCTDSYNNNDKFDLFSYVNSNIRILKGVTNKAGAQMAQPVILDRNYRCNNNELLHLEKNVFSNIIDTYSENVNNISLYSAKNITDECDNVALNISKLLRNGYLASDITVICRDLEKYLKELQFSFKKFNIPYYNDERQDISSQPLIMLVNFIFRTIIYSYKSEDVFSLLKTGLCPLSTEQISALENYAFVWNINGSDWKREFTESPKGFTEKLSDSDIEKIKALNDSRNYVVSVIEKFRRRCKDATCLDISKALYYALIDFKADENLKSLAVTLDNNGKSALADEQGRIWDMLMEILDKLAVTGKDEPITIKEYYKLFNLMISNEDLGSIPSGLDNVQVGSADRIRCDNPKVVFVVGANEGEFPQAVSSSGLLSENDRVSLINMNKDFKLYSYGETLNAQEKYFAYMALCSATEKLFVSYREGAAQGAESSIVTNIKSIFPSVPALSFNNELSVDSIESRENAFELLSTSYTENTEFISSLNEYFKNQNDYKYRLDAVERLVKNEDVTLNDKALSTELFKKDMYLSASRIEDYFNCAFRYFCKFGLGARPLLRAQMDPMQTGTVIHYVLEQIIKEKGSSGLASLSEGEIVILVNSHLEEYLKFKMGDSDKFTPRFKYQFMRLSKMLVSVVLRLKCEFEQSDFEAKAFELKIGDGTDGEEVKSHKIDLPDGGSIMIKGAVDRVDVFDKNGERYVRVVDYKSGKKEFLLSDVLYGLNLQMFIYLFTLADSDSDYNGISSGVLYMHSARNVISLDRNNDQSAAKAEENKQFKMKGLVLNDAEHEIAKHMEHDLNGEFIPVKYSDKNGVFGNIVSLEELGIISKQIDSLIAQMGVSLHSGNISQNPVNGKNHDKTCDFCDYKSVCKNRREINKKELETLDNSQALSIMKGGDLNA